MTLLKILRNSNDVSKGSVARIFSQSDFGLVLRNLKQSRSLFRGTERRFYSVTPAHTEECQEQSALLVKNSLEFRLADNGLVALEESVLGHKFGHSDEENKKAGFASIATGDILFSKNDEPWGVVLFKAHGLTFAGVLDWKSRPQRKQDRVFALPGRQFCIPKGFQSPDGIVKSVDEIWMSQSKTQACHAGTNLVFRPQPRDFDRQILTEGMHVGMLGIDSLTPISFGQSMLFASPSDTQSTQQREGYIFDAAIGAMTSKINGSDLRAWITASSSTESRSLWGSSEAVSNLFRSKGILSDKLIIVQDSSEKERDIHDSDVSGMLSAHVACSLGEQYRDSGGKSLVVIPNLHPMYRLWRRGQKLFARYRKEFCDFEAHQESVSDSDRADLRHFYSALVQRASRLNSKLGSGSLTMLQGASFGDSPERPDFEKSKKSIISADAFQGSKDYLRIKAIESRGIPLTIENLNKVGISIPPSLFQSSRSESMDSLKDLESGKTQTQHVEELKSISDGHISLSDPLNKFDFKIGDSLTRIGVGAQKTVPRDIRAPVLAQVAGPLRVKLADMSEQASFNNLAAENLELHSYILKHQFGRNLTVENEVLLLLIVSNGLLNKLKIPKREGVQLFMRALSGLKIPEYLTDAILNGSRISERELDDLKMYLQKFIGEL